MHNIEKLIAQFRREAEEAETRSERCRAEIKALADQAGSTLSPEENQRCDVLFSEIEAADAVAKAARMKLANLDKAKAEEDASDALSRQRFPAGARSGHTGTLTIGSEPRTYSRDKDPEQKGEQFLSDVAAAFRNDPSAVDRLSRHEREWQADNPRYYTRAAGDVTTGAFPNLVIPSYLVNEYAAKPTAARPFADICRHVDLPPEGMKVELAKGNTASTAALQTSELVAAGGGNFDADPLELSVQTAEAWQLVSRQSIERGRVTEQIVLNDMLDQMNALVDSTLITQATTGLYDSGTRITYDSASPTVAEMYPYILQGASKITQSLLNRGKATHVLMHPRRWYWMQSLLSSTWPLVTQPGVPAQMFATNTGAGYDQGVAGVLPCGLQVVMDANVQTAALAGAQTGGTQDVIYVVPEHECVLLEAPTRDVFIRAEAPSAPQLGVMLVAYEYFAYTFSRFASTSMQRINGTGTVPPTGF
jgi:hypothetical protein